MNVTGVLGNSNYGRVRDSNSKKKIVNVVDGGWTHKFIRKYIKPRIK